MKISNLSKWAIAGCTAMALFLTSCGDKKSDDTPKQEDPPKKEETPKKEEEPPKKEDPPVAAGGGKVEKAVNGAWAPDKESFLNMMKKEVPAELGAEQLAMMNAMVEMMADKMVIELRDGKATIYSPDGVEEETYEFVSSNDATGEFVVKMISADGSSEEGKGKVDGDSMTMATDGVSMNMNRLSAAEFAARKKAIEEFDPSSLIPGGAPGGAPEGIPVPPGG